MMRLTIIGFGNQALAWAQNLKDSGFPVQVALRSTSPSIPKARSLGVEVVEIGSEEFYQGGAFALLTPDHTHHSFLQEHASSFRPGSLILYAHGFSLLEKELQNLYQNLVHVLFAPKSIGSELRRQYELKGKLGAVYSLEHVRDRKGEVEGWLKSLAQALGINLGPYPTTFLRETQADLYSEQGLLCSLIPYTASEMFTHLVESGVEPELAYFECWHELKLIVNAMVDKGPQGFFDLISPNALIGSEKGFEKLITPDFKAHLQSLYQDIRQGSFNEEIRNSDVVAIRMKINQRWEQAPLNTAFKMINKETP